MPRWVRVYLVPGAVFQSVMIGGGYGTGRELVEYFVRYGVGGALKGIALSSIAIRSPPKLSKLVMAAPERLSLSANRLPEMVASTVEPLKEVTFIAAPP